MEKYYTWDESSKKYKGESNAQVDPIGSKRTGYVVFFGLPQNGTYEKPLDEKDGFDVVWNGSAWEYQEIPQPEPAPEPIQEEKEQMVRAIRNGYLSHWDFSQLCDAPFTEEQKDDLATYRQYLRDYTKIENWWDRNPATYEEWSVANHPVNE